MILDVPKENCAIDSAGHHIAERDEWNIEHRLVNGGEMGEHHCGLNDIRGYHHTRKVMNVRLARR